MNDIYKKLQEKFDHLSFGFTAGENGEAYPLLESKYSVEEAEFACILSADKFETAKELAQRIGEDEETVSQKLDNLAKKGLIFFKRIDGALSYRFMPWLFGVLELQNGIGENDPEYKRNLGPYMGKTFSPLMWANKTPMYRYIPVSNELITDGTVLPQDDAMFHIDSKDPDHIALAPCLCRKNTKGSGRECNHPGFEDTCLFFNDWADYYVERGVAHYISKEEAKALLKKADKEGLVIETINNEVAKGDCICMCCSCCCGPLRMLRNHPGDAIKLASNYFAEKTDQPCSGCGQCVKRCPTNAIAFDGEVTVNQSMCIGCGLCVSTCQSRTLKLTQKEGDEVVMPTIPDLYSLHEQMQKEYRERIHDTL